jgi:hypothetical protein
MRISWIVLFSAWPMCRMPVTLGGGITMEYAGFEEVSFALNCFVAIHVEYHLSSTDAGLYCLSMKEVSEKKIKTASPLFPLSASGEGKEG